MADDYKLRSYGSNDPHRRAAEPARPVNPHNSSDPLAELARLIGQGDSFADYERGSSREPLPRGYAPSQAAPEWPPATSRRYEAAQRASSYDSYPAPPNSDYAQSREPGRDARDLHGFSPDYDAHTLAPPQAPPEEGQWTQDQDQHQHYDDAYRETDEQAYDHAQAEAAPGADEEAYYRDDVPLEPHEDETYDDAPSAYRRGGFATVLALVGCALLGTAGAYAYRSYSAGPSVKEPPPVITADTSGPAKVTPAQMSANKPISDRFANASTGNEQLVSRQEEPVALRDPAAPATPRVVLPAPVEPVQPMAPAQPPAAQSAQPMQPPAPPAQAAQPSAQTPAGGEPKRVRTVTIRPDGSDPSGRPVTGTTPPAPRATAPAARSTTPPAPRAAAPAPRQGGPLSLDPQPGEPRTRTATLPRDSGVSGGYVVQLSSQRSEADAHATFRALQSKFPIELGNRQPIIRRADLGAKGVVYRTNVGPFATSHEANQFCANYKAAGGQCIVPTH